MFEVEIIWLHILYRNLFPIYSKLYSISSDSWNGMHLKNEFYNVYNVYLLSEETWSPHFCLSEIQYINSIYVNSIYTVHDHRNNTTTIMDFMSVLISRNIVSQLKLNIIVVIFLFGLQIIYIKSVKAHWQYSDSVWC